MGRSLRRRARSPSHAAEVGSVKTRPGFRYGPDKMNETSLSTRLTPSLALLLFLAARAGVAQGGPPLVTDDPGTPGDRRWEVNVAFTFEKRGSERTFETPLLDANYGLGDRIQLKVEMPWIVRGEDGRNRESGPGNALFGVKWRFLDGKSGGLSISTYPQIEINASRSSAGKGLVENEPGLLLPLLSRSNSDRCRRTSRWDTRCAEVRRAGGFAASRSDTIFPSAWKSSARFSAEPQRDSPTSAWTGIWEVAGSSRGTWCFWCLRARGSSARRGSPARVSRAIPEFNFSFKSTKFVRKTKRLNEIGSSWRLPAFMLRSPAGL